MRCPSCDHDNREGQKFCGECGAPLALRCPHCGTPYEAGEKFCGECGASLAESAKPILSSVEGLKSQSSPRGPRAQNLEPRAYTPKHLAEKILTSRAALEGERKQVTVLFADVKGSMELAEQVDPEEWHRILDRFFQILTDGVHRFEGTVNQYTGDGIMALFGAPIAHEDHAQRACYAALHLQDEIARYATELKREHGVGFQARIGIHSGEVVVGSIGDDLRMDYTAQGHTVGLAQRMESHILEGRSDEAVEALESALSLLRTTGTTAVYEAIFLDCLAEAELLRGNAERACALSRGAIDLTERGGLRIEECTARRHRALSLLRAHAASAQEEALGELRRCEALIHELGLRRELPFLHTVRAELARTLVDGPTCARELREAQRLFAEMGAFGWAERLGKELQP